MNQLKRTALLCAVVLAITSCGTPAVSSSTATVSTSTPAVSSSSTPTVSSSTAEPAPIGNEVSMEGQTLGLVNVANARELAGYATTTGMKIKKNKLLRTGKLGTATPEDIATLMAHELHTVIDFRTSVEVAEEPDPTLPGVTQVHIKIYDESGDKETLSTPKGGNQDYGKMMVGLYEKGLLDPDMYTMNLEDPIVQAGFATFLQLVAKESAKDGAILYHCTSGKDRVGLGTMLLLSILEVDRETILNDFTLSNDFHKNAIDYIRAEVEKITDDPATIEGTASLAGVVRANMENTLNHLDETYGSPLQYVTDVLGITDAEISALRENLLEPV